MACPVVTYDNPSDENDAWEEENSHNGDHTQIKIDMTNLKIEKDGGRLIIETIQLTLRNTYAKNQAFVRISCFCAIALFFLAYFAYAMYFRFGDEGSIRLLVYAFFGALFLMVRVLSKRNHSGFWLRLDTTLKFRVGRKRLDIASWVLKVAVALFLVVYITIDVLVDHPGNLVSVGGLAVFIILFYLTSTNPAKVQWHPVFWGIALQYLFALLILRTSWGYEIFKYLGDRITDFLSYSHVGAEFAFGESYEDHLFAFKILPVFVYMYMIITILDYLGVTLFLVRAIGGFLAFCMNTTPAESLSAAANIFLGPIDSPLMVNNFLSEMTKSELHAIMAGGFATIAGSVLGAFISFGVPASHLITASVMSAPAALALSKVACPETKKSTRNISDFYKVSTSKERNILQAAAAGAMSSIKLVAAVAVNVIAFLALLAFVNGSLTWIGDRIGIEGFTFEFICSYLLYPVAYLMGTDADDCSKLAELIGIKTFTNEFIAYLRLSKLIQNGKVFNNYTSFYNATGSWYAENGNIVLGDWQNTTLIGGYMSAKSELISTYALCGFSNFGAVGFVIGALGALAPTRRRDILRLVVRAMVVGNVACFMTACVAGNQIRSGQGYGIWSGQAEKDVFLDSQIRSGQDEMGVSLDIEIWYGQAEVVVSLDIQIWSGQMEVDVSLGGSLQDSV
ncbi:hypothetical protein ScPMuIL_016247 [Solemya velum]